jgi:competence protein ComEC
MALHFQQLSLASLPANLLAAPAIAPVMWLGVLAGVAAQIAAPLALPFAALTAPLLVYLQRVAQLTAATPISTIEFEASPALIALAAVAAAGVSVVVARAWRRRRSVRRAWLVPIAGAAAVLALSLRGAEAAPRPGELVVSFLDVGQGDATLIQLGRTAVLVDTGPPEGPVVKRLRQSGVERLDALFLTHAEADHEGAAPQVIAGFKPRLVVDGGAGWHSPVQRALPQAVAAAKSRAVAPSSGERIDVGGLRFAILWPKAADVHEGNPNDHAIVARLTHGAFSMLLTADAESNVTTPLDLEPVDVLKVAHHGSADPGLAQLLERLRPRIAAIEVGRRNRYGHPAKSTLAALLAKVPSVYRTDRDGTIRLRVINDRISVQR